MGPQLLPAGEMLQPRRRPVVGVHHTWTAGGGAFTETGLMFRCFVMRLVSLAVVRKRAGRGESGPVAAKAPRRMRGPGRALSSNVRASCGRPVPRSSVAIVIVLVLVCEPVHRERGSCPPLLTLNIATGLYKTFCVCL